MGCKQGFYKVILDGRVYLMPDLDVADGAVAPVWTDADPDPDALSRLARGEGRRLPLTEQEERRLAAGYVTSDRFRLLQTHERLHSLALGYLQSAKSLCTELIDKEHLLSWPRASAVYYCSHLAVELFLKAAIQSRSGSFASIHSIAGLVKEYRRLFPEPVYFFRTVWDMDLDDIEELVGGSIGNKVDRKADQVYRYFSGRSGELPSASHGFSPGVWLFGLDLLEKRWTEIWPLICERSGEQTESQERPS